MSSFARVTKIVERRDAVCLGPNTDFARVLKRVVIPFDRFPSIERDGEMITLEIHPQRVPRAGSDLHIRAFLLGTLAFDGVVNRHVVFESVRARNVVLFASCRRQITPPAWSSLPAIGLNFTSTKPSLMLVPFLKQTGKVACPDCFNTFGLLGAELSLSTVHFAVPLPVCVAVQPGGGTPAFMSSSLLSRHRPELLPWSSQSW